MVALVAAWRYFVGLRNPDVPDRAKKLRRRVAAGLLVATCLLGAVLVIVEASESLEMADEHIAFIIEQIEMTSNEWSGQQDYKRELERDQRERALIVAARPLAGAWVVLSIVAAGLLLVLPRGASTG